MNRCIINCGSKVSMSRRMIIEVICSGFYCFEDISYSWVLYKFMFLENSLFWLKIYDFESYIFIYLDSINIVFFGLRKLLE